MCLRMAGLQLSGLQHPLQFIYSSFVALSVRAGEFLSSMEQFLDIQYCLFLTRFHRFNVDSVNFVQNISPLLLQKSFLHVLHLYSVFIILFLYNLEYYFLSLGSIHFNKYSRLFCYSCMLYDFFLCQDQVILVVFFQSICPY